MLAQNNIVVPDAPPLTCDLAEWLSVPHAYMNELITRFNNSEKFEYMTTRQGARGCIETFKRRGYKLIVISSCGASVEDRRKQNLMDRFGDVFDKIHCLPLGAGKQDILEQYEPSWWVEDNYKHALSGLTFGHKPIMIHCANNYKDRAGAHADIKWARSWWQIAAHIFNTNEGKT